VVPNFIGGSRLVDLAGRNHGTLTNVPWSSAAGRPGGSGSVVGNGTSGVVTTTLTPSGWPLSFAVWLKVNTATSLNYCNVFGTKSTSGGHGLVIKWSSDSSGGYYIEARGATAASTSLGYGLGYGASGWHHIAVTCSGTSLLFYLDGLQVASNGTTLGDPTHESAVVMLARAYGGANYYGGNLDDAMVFNNTILSASQIYALYQATRSDYDPTLNYNNFAYYANVNTYSGVANNNIFRSFIRGRR